MIAYRGKYIRKNWVCFTRCQPSAENVIRWIHISYIFWTRSTLSQTLWTSRRRRCSEGWCWRSHWSGWARGREDRRKCTCTIRKFTMQSLLGRNNQHLFVTVWQMLVQTHFLRIAPERMCPFSFAFACCSCFSVLCLISENWQKSIFAEIIAMSK